MYYINTLKRELVDTNAYKLQPSLSERVIVDGHGCHSITALHFGVKAKENQDKVPTLYWLPKLHKKPYKARFIANSSSCTTTELSKLLTSCLTAVKKHVIKYCELEDLKVLRRSPDLLNNVKIGQGQLQLIMEQIMFYHICCRHFGQVT